MDEIYFLQMVPINQMTDVLRVVKEVPTLKRGAWVRLKRGELIPGSVVIF